MIAGKMDRRITIQRATTSQDVTGQEIATWATLAVVWGSWRRASARETLAGAEISATITDVFEIRYSTDVSDLNPTDRLTYNGRIYDIAEVAEIDRRDGLRISAIARGEIT